MKQPLSRHMHAPHAHVRNSLVAETERFNLHQLQCETLVDNDRRTVLPSLSSVVFLPFNRNIYVADKKVRGRFFCVCAIQLHHPHVRVHVYEDWRRIDSTGPAVDRQDS